MHSMMCCCCCCCLQLFHSLKSHAPGDSEWDDLVAFLQEFCSLAKHLQMQHRQNLWNKMTQLGMFEVGRATVMTVCCASGWQLGCGQGVLQCQQGCKAPWNWHLWVSRT